MHDDKPPIGIAQISGLLFWCESLVLTLAGPLLLFVAVLTVANALNGGTLFDTSPQFRSAFAWCQGIGIEGQLTAMAFRGMRSFGQGRTLSGIGYWSVVLLLAAVSIMTGGAVNYQETFHVPFTEALIQVGISQGLWVWVRIVVLIFLVVLSAAMRYQPPVVVSADETIKRLQEKQRIEAEKAKLRSQQMAGWAQGLAGAVRQAQGSLEETGIAESVPEPATSSPNGASPNA